MNRIALTALAALLTACAATTPTQGWTTLIDGDKGLANFDVVGQANWSGADGAVQASAGTPPAIVKLLHNAFVAILKSPDIVARITSDGGIPVGNTPQQYAQELRDETAKWAKVIKAANIKL